LQATLTVSCKGCSGGPPSNYQWTGSIEILIPSQEFYTALGNSAVDYNLYSNTSYWTIWFSFGKQTSQGTLQVILTLNNGNIVFNKSINHPFGRVSGSYTN
jgi:spore coat protein U-like protein